MQLLKMEPGKPQCLLYAAAMMLITSVENLIVHLGHDGMEVVNPQYTDARRYKSIHIQEIIDLFIRWGYGLMPMELHPKIASSPNDRAIECYTLGEAGLRFTHILEDRWAIIIGSHKTRIMSHAWAWDGHKCYDPNGFIAELNDYNIQEAWIKVKLI